MNKLLITTIILTVTTIHVSIQPAQKVKFNEETKITIKEYEANCVGDSLIVSPYYNCFDLKNYLHKRGYSE